MADGRQHPAAKQANPGPGCARLLRFDFGADGLDTFEQRAVRTGNRQRGRPLPTPGTPEQDRTGAVHALDRLQIPVRIIAGRQIAQTKLKPGNRWRQGDQSPVAGKPDLHPVRLTHCFYGRHRHRSSQDPCRAPPHDCPALLLIR
jgi:hypothetical protein